MNDHESPTIPPHNEPATIPPSLPTEPLAPAGESRRVRYVGEYEVEGEIARGGMGVVFRARHRQLGRPVALKMVLSGELAGAQEMARFRLEAAASANLDHPNIVPIYEVGEHEGLPFFSMKLVEGGSLAAAVAGRSLDARGSAALVATVARAVHHAHQRGILHRDLKPANVLLDADRNPHVTDFGLARRVGGEGQTASGAILGTPSYMAPEQAQACKDVTTAVDVYALGAILYECLTGRPPFRAQTPLDTIMQVLGREPERPRSIDATIDRDLETIALKCLEKEPGRRYGSALELAEELERWLRGEPIAARPVGRLTKGWRWARRNPAVAGLSAAVFVALAGVAALGWLAAQGAGKVAEAERDRGEEARKRELAATELADTLRTAAIKEKERLRQALFDQARAERMTGNRRRALELLVEASKVRGENDDLRLEATAAITRAGIGPLLELPYECPFGEVRGVHPDFRWNKRPPQAGGADFPAYLKCPDRETRGATYYLGAGYNNLPVVSGDGKYLAVGYPGVRVFELPAGKVLRETRRSACLIAFRPHTAQLALLWGGGTSLWDPLTGKSRAYPGDGDRLAFSTGGRYLVSHEDQHNPVKTRIWDLQAGRGVPLRAGRAADLWSAGAMNNLTTPYLLAWRAYRADWDGGEPVPPPSKGRFQCFLSDHELLLLDGRRYQVWDCRTGKDRFGTPEALAAIGHSAEARLAAVRGRLGDSREELHVWDLEAGKRAGTVPGLSAFPDHVTFSADRHYLAFDEPGAKGDTVRVWDLRTGQDCIRLRTPRGLTLLTVAPLPQAEQALTSAIGRWRSFNPDGSLLAALVARQQQLVLCVWDTTTGEVLAALPDVEDHAWLTDGRLFVRGREGPARNKRTFYGFREVARPAPIYSLDGPIESLSLNPSGTRLAVNDKVCEVAKGTQGQQLVSWATPEAGVIPQFVGEDEVWAAREIDDPRWKDSKQTELLQLAPARRSIVLPDDPERLIKRNEPGRVMREYGANQKWAFSPAGRFWVRVGDLANREYDEKGRSRGGWGRRPKQLLELWEPGKGHRLANWSSDSLGGGQINWDGTGLLCCQCSPDGRRAATGAESKVINWDLEARKAERRLTHRGDDVRFSPDGQRLLAVEAGKKATLFEVSTGKQVQTWEVGRGGWSAAAIHPDGKLLASGGADRYIRLWDVATGQERARWEGHESGVSALAFHPDGKTLYSGSLGGTLKLWDLPFVRKELANLGLDWK